MAEHPITQATELRNLAKQLAGWVTEEIAKGKAQRIAERAERLLRDLERVLPDPQSVWNSNKSEWE